MKPCLLDANELLAIGFRRHEHHGLAAVWGRRNIAAGFCARPVTEAGFVRISSNNEFSHGNITARALPGLLGGMRSALRMGFGRTTGTY